MRQPGRGTPLELAAYAGQIMLESGGEIYRVEETMGHFCRALGLTEYEGSATPTTIVLSAKDETGDIKTLMRRIVSRGINLEKVEAVNSLSRSLGDLALDAEEIHLHLQAIHRGPSRYPFPVELIAAALGTGFFTLLFSGGAATFFAAAIFGALWRLLFRFLQKQQLGDFFLNTVGGAYATLCGYLCHLAGISSGGSLVSLAILMQMVPGMLFTNALRDIAVGDLVAGMSRAIEALCIAAALACGASLVQMVFGAGIGG